MGKTDIYESDYLENPEIFADLVNGILYEGERQIYSCYYNCGILWKRKTMGWRKGTI